MLKFKFLLLTTLIPITIFTQSTSSINGNVKIQNTNKSLPYVQIIIENTYIGTTTDENGIFTLDNIPNDSFNLIVSHLGYISEIINIHPHTSDDIEIFLRQSPISVEEILVTGERSLTYNSDKYSFKDTGNSPNDVGQFFKTISGASAVKKGGFAMDPTIRGFKMDQLNVQVDGGCKCWGGCPNRMDPPTSHIQSDDIERIQVIKGPFSVRWGPTMGGIVNLVMKRPELGSNFNINGIFNAGYESNGGSRKERLTLKGGSEKWDFYLGGGEKVFGNYTTGGNNLEIPSAFTMRDYSVKFGVNPSIDSRIQLSWRQSFARDVSYPALPMDAAIDDTDIIMLDYSGRNIGKLISSISAKVYYNTVNHVMDNFDRTNFKLVESETVADAMTYGGRFEIGSQLINGSKFYFGNDYYKHYKDGTRTRFVKTNPCNTEQHPNKEFVDLIWQESSIDNYGIFSEYNQIISNDLSLNTGIRYDIVNAQIADPSAQFIEAYGNESQFIDNNLSLTGSLRYAISSDLRTTLSIGRGTRSADITERFINHLPIGKSPHEHFGNPYLKPEINDQVELAMNSIISGQLLKVNVFYSKLSNYILAKVDSSIGRLYLPCSEPKFTKVFGNINEAYQYGYEIELSGNLYDNIMYFTSIAYLYGQNKDLNEPLPEIAPFTANYLIKYDPININGWVELNGRSVTKQNRISSTYGESETNGYNIFGIAAGYRIKNVLLLLDIHNIFDEVYYEHLNRSFAKNIEDSGIPYYEPGRNITFNIEITM